ncbi:MAG TPA: hypothetical protein VE688_01315 [Gaiellaceae bacterium]|nr:hypothetical protein [Gaiellaceae bacterium]
MSRRCHVVYAIAPEGVSAREANDLLNEYVEDRRRGISVLHDHFTGKPHGVIAVWDVCDEAEEALLNDPGPLAGWDLRSHALTFALTAVGFAAQIDFSLEHYADTSLAQLEVEEGDDPRYWWQKR